MKLSQRQTFSVALVGTLVLHGAAALALALAKPKERKLPPMHLDVQVKRRPKPRVEQAHWEPPALPELPKVAVRPPEPPKPAALPPPPPPPKPAVQKPKAKKVAQVERPVKPVPKPVDDEPPPEVKPDEKPAEEPVPGEKTDTPPAQGEGGAGTPAYQMDELGDVVTPKGEGGSGGGTGHGTGRRSGEKGGSGDGGQGGTEDGEGKAQTATVATVQKQPEVIGDFDRFQLKKDYPPEALRLGIEGELIVRIYVDADGRVTQVRVKKGLGHGLDQKAKELARTIKFKPAIKNDQPVGMWITWTFHFTLPQ